MSESNDMIEIFDDESEIVIEPIDNKDLYDIKGNLITSDDAKSTLPDNTDLIQKAMDGNKQAFETLYMQSYRYVFFVVRQFIPDDETTYDAIQEVFIKVYKNISNLNNPKAYYNWLTSIAKNTAIDILRTTRFETSLSYEEENYSDFLNEDETQKDVSLDIEAVLKKLTPADADLLSLVYYDGMRISQIAKMQGVPATTVYSRFNKAKRNLKAQLNAHGIDKAIYSGNFISMVTVAIRNIIGTTLLSLAIAQQILDSIINGKGKKELAVAKIIRSHQKKLALKIASCLVAVCIFASCFTVLMLTNWGKNFKQKIVETVKTVTEYHYYNANSSNAEDSSTEGEGAFWQNLFGGNSSQNDTSSQQSNTSNSSDSTGQNPFENNSSKNDTIPDNNSMFSGFLGNIFGYDEEDLSHITDSEYVSDEDNAHQNESTTSVDNATSKEETPTQSSLSSDLSNIPSGDTFVLPNFTAPTVPADFVPDCDPSQYNTVGNLYHNTTLHFGNVARQGDWIYYAALDEKEPFITSLYKVKTDGTKKQILAQNVMAAPNINIVGEWIYFIDGHILSDYHLARMRTDGTGRQQLTDFKVDGLQVIGDIAYFCAGRLTDENYNYYKLNLKTGETALFIENAKDMLACITDKYLLYRPDGTAGNLCVYDNKTGELVRSFEGQGLQVYKNIIVVGESDGKALYNLDNLDKNPIKITQSNLSDWSNFLFYSPYNGGIFGCEIKISDTQTEWGILKLSDYSFESWPFSWERSSLDDCTDYSTFDDGYIYYVADEKLYRSRPDGSDCTVY